VLVSKTKLTKKFASGSISGTLLDSYPNRVINAGSGFATLPACRCSACGPVLPVKVTLFFLYIVLILLFCSGFQFSYLFFSSGFQFSYLSFSSGFHFSYLFSVPDFSSRTCFQFRLSVLILVFSSGFQFSYLFSVPDFSSHTCFSVPDF
jgi:hypothetical protein